MKEYIVRCDQKITVEGEIVRCKECRNRYTQQRCAGRHPNWFCADGVKQVTGKLKNPDDSLVTDDSEACKEQKSKLESDLISRQAAIEAVEKQYFGGTVADINPSWRKLHNILESLPPVTPTEQNEGDILKFYYVESLDEYWIGQRCGTRYYGKWTGNCFTYGYSRYLPWGEHVVAPDTLWKEHTYPSEPKEIPFNEWLTGFLEKEALNGRPKGEWIDREQCQVDEDAYDVAICSNCKAEITLEYPNDSYCPNCGADMKGDKE